MQQLGLKNIPEEPVPNEEGTKMEETPNANMNK